MREQSGNTSFYVKDKELYLKRISTIREIWYDLYMEHLSTSVIVIRSLGLMLESLQEEDLFKKSDNSRKISDKYSGVGE